MLPAQLRHSFTWRAKSCLFPLVGHEQPLLAIHLLWSSHLACFGSGLAGRAHGAGAGNTGPGVGLYAAAASSALAKCVGGTSHI